MASSLLLALFALLGVAQGLQLSPGAVAHQPRLTVRRAVGPSCQFGGGEEPKGLTRENEPEEFFSTNMGATPPRRRRARPAANVCGRCVYARHPHPARARPSAVTAVALPPTHRRHVGCGEDQEPGRDHRPCDPGPSLHRRCGRSQRLQVSLRSGWGGRHRGMVPTQAVALERVESSGAGCTSSALEAPRAGHALNVAASAGKRLEPARDGRCRILRPVGAGPGGLG